VDAFLSDGSRHAVVHRHRGVLLAEVLIPLLRAARRCATDSSGTGSCRRRGVALIGGLSLALTLRGTAGQRGLNLAFSHGSLYGAAWGLAIVRYFCSLGIADRGASASPGIVLLGLVSEMPLVPAFAMRPRFPHRHVDGFFRSGALPLRGMHRGKASHSEGEPMRPSVADLRRSDATGAPRRRSGPCREWGTMSKKSS